MDPITLTLLFGAGALVGFAAQGEINDSSVDRNIVIRRLFETSDGWLCTELMSPAALAGVGQLMDLDLQQWWPKVQSGLYKVVAITQPGGPLDHQVVALLEGAGDYGWSLDQAYRHGYRKVDQRIDYQRIQSLLQYLNTDPADVVVEQATLMNDPVQRYHYLRYALTANPELSAMLSRDDLFVEVVRRTVKAPSVERLKAEQEARQMLPGPAATDLVAVEAMGVLDDDEDDEDDEDFGALGFDWVGGAVVDELFGPDLS